MRVGFVTASLAPQTGGMAAAVHSLAVALRARGAEIAILTSAGDAVSETHDLEVTTLPVRGPRRYGFMPGLAGALDGAGLDLLHVHGIWMYPTLAARRWAERNGKPFLVSPHGMLDAWALRNGRWRKCAAWNLYEHRNLSRAACLHALSHAELRAMRALRLANPVAVIANGAAVPAAPVGSGPAANGRKTLLFLGRLHPKKGLAELIEAWRRLKQQRPDLVGRWLLVLAGWDDGGHEAGLRALVREAGLVDDVHFPGAVFGEDKERLLRGAAAMILPSHSEGMPMSVLEAWSYELPVFMSAACNLPEGFAAGAAMEVRPEPAHIATALAGTLDDAAALRRMGEHGRALVVERFAWAKVADETLALYGWLAGARPLPDCVDVDEEAVAR